MASINVNEEMPRFSFSGKSHRIFITFIDVVPQMEIPAGYYPVGDSEVVAPTAPTPPVGGSGGSDMGDSGSGQAELRKHLRVAI